MLRVDSPPRPSRTPEVVFLDVGDTLIRAHPSWAAVYRQGLREFGIEVTEKDLERALLEETQADAWWLDRGRRSSRPRRTRGRRIVAFDRAVLGRLGTD